MAFGVVTITRPVVAPVGTRAVIYVSDTTVNLAAAVPLNETALKNRKNKNPNLLRLSLMWAEQRDQILRLSFLDEEFCWVESVRIMLPQTNTPYRLSTLAVN